MTARQQSVAPVISVVSQVRGALLRGVVWVVAGALVTGLLAWSATGNMELAVALGAAQVLFWGLKASLTATEEN